MPVVSPALVVDLNAPDKVIRHEFERMLKKARKRFRPPASKPGRWAMNACFDDRVFKKWRNDRIVQLADLLAWRSTLSPSEKAAGPNSVLVSDSGKIETLTTAESARRRKFEGSVGLLARSCSANTARKNVKYSNMLFNKA